jgi:alanine racemase
MSTGTLTINLGALERNLRDLDGRTGVETGAVVKANAYGLGIRPVVKRLAKAGVRKFFAAVAEEGRDLRRVLGEGPEVFIFSGHMVGEADTLREHGLTPLLNDADQMLRHFETLPGHPFGIQLDTGMNRLGMEPAEWQAVREVALGQGPRLLMSHLACADEPDHPMNARQLRVFRDMTDGADVPRSLAATGGIMLGPEYHFDLCRPGVGLYGGLPFVDAAPVVTLDLPVIQCRTVAPGESVGYGNTWVAKQEARIATVSGGYADGIIRAMGPRAQFHAGDIPVPVVGRISMDLIGVDITPLERDPADLQLLGLHQSIDTVAAMAGTIGYEVLTSLGNRYDRQITG